MSPVLSVRVSAITLAAILAVSVNAACSAAPEASPKATPETAPQVVAAGVTDLLQNPACTVGYQRFGEAAHVLGWRWTGYDSESGVYFIPGDQEAGQSALFMHCPWQQGTGVTFASFPLRLPTVTPIRLLLRTALRAAAIHSDGVTYRVKVGDAVLWQATGDWKTWRDFTVDLSRFAGQVIALRLEVDPGPKRDPTEDWSLWARAKIVAGSAKQVQVAEARARAQAQVQRQQDFTAGARAAGLNLLPISSGGERDSCPDTTSSVQHWLRQSDGDFALLCKAADETIEYHLRPAMGIPGGLDVRVNGKALNPAPFTGGPTLLLGGQEWSPATSGLKMTLLSARAQGQDIQLRYHCTVRGVAGAADLSVGLRVQGKSLVVSLDAQADVVGFTLNPHCGPEVPTPFVTGCVPCYHPDGVYVSSFADLWHSNASALGPEGQQYQTAYSPLTNGARHPMHDTFFLTVSHDYDDTLANIPHAPSAYLQDLAHRVVLDAWDGSFSDTRQWLQNIATYGVDHLLVIKHVWQHDGYDHSYPDVMPANAAMGGDSALRSLADAAKAIGDRFCLHENFYDYYPNAKDFRPADCALDSSGHRLSGWNNGSVQADILKPSLLMEYARRFSPELERRYGTNAAYHDIMPTWNVDFDARVPGAGIIRKTHEYTEDLCKFDHELYQGPVVFEAADAVLAGVYDGGCNHSLNMSSQPAAVAFELLKVHPKMSNHGFGYYERWLPWGYGDGWATYVMTDRELDRYRAMEVAFGRTGFIGHQLMICPHDVAREYYLMQAFGRAYTGQPVQKIAYNADGQWIDAGTAARYNEITRLRVLYKGGQVVYVNLSAQPWPVDGHVLPSGGTFTTGPRSTAYTALIKNQVADFASYGSFTYADARSDVWLPPAAPAPVKPTIGAFKDHGDGTFDLSLQWNVGRRLHRDYTIFWHFRSHGQILFQRDHQPATPTSQWTVGSVITDGPFSLSVPAGPQTDYDVYTGLYDSRGRASLAYGADEMRVGVLHVTRDGDRAVKITLAPVSDPPPPGATPGPYLDGANRSKSVVDFGPVATNGAFVLHKTGAGREIIPVPAGQAMRVGLQGAFRHAVAHRSGATGDIRVPLQKADGKTWMQIPAGATSVRLE